MVRKKSSNTNDAKTLADLKALRIELQSRAYMVVSIFWGIFIGILIGLFSIMIYDQVIITLSKKVQGIIAVLVALFLLFFMKVMYEDHKKVATTPESLNKMISSLEKK